MDLDGKRRRYYHEREQNEANEGSPLREGISREARSRLVIEILHALQGYVAFDKFFQELSRVYRMRIDTTNLEDRFAGARTSEFCTLIEIGADLVFGLARMRGIDILQSILADDLSLYRIRKIETDSFPEFHVQRIDNDHLHRVITDRTFELTRIASFASAQADYADAWRNYSHGDLDGALVSAAKAVESACKIVIKRADPSLPCEDKVLTKLVEMLAQSNILPSTMQNVFAQLKAIFSASGSVRNSPGAAHGSLELVSPEASVVLLSLRLSGSLIAFLAERYEQIRPPSVP